MIVRDRLGLLVNDARLHGYPAVLAAAVSSDTYAHTETPPVYSPQPEYASDSYNTSSPPVVQSYTPVATESQESSGVGSTIASIFGTLLQVGGGVATQLLRPQGGGYTPPLPKTGLAAVPTWAWIGGGAVVVLGLTGAIAFSGKKASLAGYHGRSAKRIRR